MLKQFIHNYLNHKLNKNTNQALQVSFNTKVSKIQKHEQLQFKTTKVLQLLSL